MLKRLFLITMMFSTNLIAQSYPYNQALTTNYLWLDMIYMKNPPSVDEQGNQILHFATRNRNPFIDDASGATANYIQRHLSSCKIFYSDADILKFAVETALPVSGFFLEFGVGVGKTTNFTAALAPFRILHGFDSFCGLPEDWTPRCPKGNFAFKDKSKLPPLHANVLLHKGLFEEVLPSFQRNFLKNDVIAFIHIDCDIYSSTKSIFDYLGNNVVAGTIIIFDEYFGYNGWQEHEFKAFQEFVISKGLKYEYLAYNAFHQQVVIRILNKSEETQKS